MKDLNDNYQISYRLGCVKREVSVMISNLSIVGFVNKCNAVNVVDKCDALFLLEVIFEIFNT